MMRLVAFLASLVIRVLCATLRVRHVGREHIDATPQYILALWHRHLVPGLGRGAWRRPITVLVSRSKDGELIARVLSWYDVESARGSSTRGGSTAIREMLRVARAGRNIVFTPDGPKGPACIAKDGVVYAAQVTGLPVQPFAFGAARAKILGTWDRMVIPAPFTRCVFVYGAPITSPREGDVEEWRMKVEERLNALTEEAEGEFERLWEMGR